MNATGNLLIGKTKKYNQMIRDRISTVIRKEWSKVKANPPSAEAFARTMLPILKDSGFRSPEGQPLTLRGVKYQVQRTGIRFKGRVSRMKATEEDAVILHTPTPSTIERFEVQHTKPESKEDRVTMVNSLSRIPMALKGILEDESLTAKQRKQMFEAYFDL